MKRIYANRHHVYDPACTENLFDLYIKMIVELGSDTEREDQGQ